MKRVQYTNTLFYYDGLQVFEARDAIGGHYIALMIKSEDMHDRYLVTGVAPERLRQFRSGTLDLRSLLAGSGEEEWYLATMAAGLDKPLELSQQNTSLAESGFLPDAGFVLHQRPAGESVLKEARERNNLVLEISTDPPEATMEHRMRANTLGGLLIHVQTMVKHAHRKAMKAKTQRYRQPDEDIMDVVVPAAAGSFRIILEAANLPDMFGDNNLKFALQQIDMLFSHAANPQDALASIGEYRGHLAGSYLKLLRFLVDHRTGLRYSWAEPSSERPSNHAVSEAEAGPLIDVLSNVTNLGSESVTLTGDFESFNRASGSWGILTNEGKFFGKVKEEGPSLDGLKVGGRYTFYCDEEIEEVDITGRESRKLYLNKHETA